MLWATAGIIAYAVSVLLSQLPSLTEWLYGETLGPWIAWLLSRATGWIPLALGELVVLALILRQLVGGTFAVIDVLRSQRQWTNALAGGTLRLGQDVGVLVTLFYVLWGFNYSRAELDQRLGWSTPISIEAVELTDLANQLVTAANESYREIHGTDDAGEPTQLPANRAPVEDAITAGWLRARRQLDLPALTVSYGRAKTPLLTPWYELVGVAGFYFPFTGEANLRAGIPAVDQPKMLAHEEAHQRGVAREDEANFWGYLSAVHAPNAYARYSAFVFAQQQLMAALARVDRNQWLAFAEQRLPGVQRDIDESREYWRRFRGRGTRIGTRVNDAFLRTNRVAGGIHSYSRSALLLISYARAHDGQLVPAGGTSAGGNEPLSQPVGLDRGR
ncbi:MAG: hypothetical protein AMS18_17670 [Gemmatimonas sp. SG8_17]|nr:MAG: hypothetical protein AMS18_17670 [Gemmatimonas sp. SG8_17]